MIKVKVSFHVSMSYICSESEEFEFEFDSNTTPAQIDDFLEQEYKEWLSNHVHREYVILEKTTL